MTEADAESLGMLYKQIKGGTSERRGTLQAYLDRMTAASNPGIVHFAANSYLR